MGKYEPLTKFLKNKPDNSVELTFAKIEDIIQDKLPPGALRLFRDWDNGASSLQKGWRNAGWKTVMVDIENKKVRFQRELS